MVHKLCFIAGCNGKDNENGPQHVFGIPKKYFEVWEREIPKKGLHEKSRLCWRHFDEEDIVRGRTISGVFYPYKRWTLREEAIPKHLLGSSGIKCKPLSDLNCDLYTTKKKPQSRSKNINSILGACLSTHDTTMNSLIVEDYNTVDIPRAEANEHSESANIHDLGEVTSIESSLCEVVEPVSPIPTSGLTAMHSTLIEDYNTDELPSAETYEHSDSYPANRSDLAELTSIQSSLGEVVKPVSLLQTIVSDENAIDTQHFSEMKRMVQLPSDNWKWSYNEDSKRALCFFAEELSCGNIGLKAMNCLTTMKANFHINGKTVTLPGCDGKFRSYDELSLYLLTLHKIKRCNGILNDAFANVNVTGKCSVIKNGSVWRSSKCDYFMSTENKIGLCLACSKSLRYLRKRAMQPKNMVVAKKKMNVVHKKIRRLKSRGVVISNFIVL